VTSHVRRTVIALVVAYAAASVIAYVAKDYYLNAILPAIGPIVDLLLPNGVERTALAITPSQHQTLIALRATLIEPVQARHALVPAGESVSSSTLGAYALHHVALVVAVLAAWPAQTAQGRLALLLLAAPAVLLATLLDVPFVLAGLVHELLISSGATGVASEGLRIYYEFVHRGGRLALSIVMAVSVGLAVSAGESRIVTKR